MNKYGWADAALKVMPYIVRIELPDNYGSGFVINYREDGPQKRVVVIATAFHVIEHAEKWGELIRVIRGDTVVVLAPSNRRIFGFEEQDLALLMFDADGLKLPDKILQTGSTEVLPPGFPVGWCGFPNIADQYECFFAGHISTALPTKGDYLVDGVAIHGISGGPAFIHVDNKVTLIGVVSAYYPNRATGESLPGMSLIRSVNPFTEFFDKNNKECEKRVQQARRQKAKRKATSRGQ